MQAILACALGSLHCYPAIQPHSKQLKGQAAAAITKIASDKKIPTRTQQTPCNRIHQNTAKAKAGHAVLLFVVLSIACNCFGDAEAALVTMQLPVCNHCLQLHCSAPCVRTTMQYSCYEFKMQSNKFQMVGWDTIHWCG